MGQMLTFYCEDCKVGLGLPETEQKTLIQCQMCDSWAICHTSQRGLSMEARFERHVMPQELERLREWRADRHNRSQP